MPVDIVHCIAVELRAMLGRMFAARREASVVAMAVIEMMIYVPIEMLRPVKPGSRADEDAARKPFGSIVAVWRAVIGWSLVIAVRTNRWLADADCNLCMRFLRWDKQTTGRHSH